MEVESSIKRLRTEGDDLDDRELKRCSASDCVGYEQACHPSQANADLQLCAEEIQPSSISEFHSACEAAYPPTTNQDRSPSPSTTVSADAIAQQVMVQLARQRAQAAAALSCSIQSEMDANTRHARKVYVGNLLLPVTEAEVQQFFNDTLTSLLPNKPPGPPVVGVYLNQARRFAFVEHRSIEEANFTLGLDGIAWRGSALKLRHPQDYNPAVAAAQLQQELEMKGGNSCLANAKIFIPEASLIAGALGIVSTTVEDGPNKVFVGGLPYHMTEDQCKSLLEAFGPLKSLHLVKDRERAQGKGFAFCEYRDGTTTDLACRALNGMRVGDRTLNVRRAAPHYQYKATSIGCLPGQFGGSSQSPSMPSPLANSSPAFPSPYQSKPTRVIAIKNMAQYHMLMDEKEKNRLLSDVQTECSKMGLVFAVEMVEGSIYVEFSSPDESEACALSLKGRLYDGRPLEVLFTEPTPEMKKAAVKRIVEETALRSNNEEVNITAERPADGQDVSSQEQNGNTSGTLPNGDFCTLTKNGTTSCPSPTVHRQGEMGNEEQQVQAENEPQQEQLQLGNELQQQQAQLENETQQHQAQLENETQQHQVQLENEPQQQQVQLENEPQQEQQAQRGSETHQQRLLQLESEAQQEPVQLENVTTSATSTFLS